MSDMVCRKSMMRCQTPGMCSPHGGCRDEVTTAKDRQISALIAENERLKNRLEVDPRHDYDGISTRDATVKVLDEQVDQLKADNERLRADYAGLARFNPEWDRVAAAQDSVREHMAMVVQLKAEVAGLRTGYEAYEQVVQGLKAENEALRDDLEQVQYEADAWRNREESLWIEVYYGKGDDPSISAVQGAICIEELAKIQGVFLEYPDDYFEHGSGLYVFRCGHHEAHYDNVGMTEPAHWEIEFESHSRFPWADEQPSTCGSEQDQNSTETPIPERSACRSESP